MINPKELRIGNWVQTARYLPQPGQILYFTQRIISLKLEYSTLKCVTHRGIKGLDADPILLNRKVLEKCGFKYIEETGGYADAYHF